jgi:hypothetical protein
VSLALVANSTIAQTINVVGVGATSCTQFIEEIGRKPATELTYLAWAQGFLSGALLRAPKGVDEDLDLLPPSFPIEKQAQFLRTFCTGNPTQDYMDGVHALYQRLKGSPS